MKFVLFYHSFASCWNHGSAHFLRGICRELLALGHQVSVYEPQDGWSRTNALHDEGAAALLEAAKLVPGVELHLYTADGLRLDKALSGADVVIVHEWNPASLVAAIGRHRAKTGRYTLLFHDTHHRAISAPDELGAGLIEDYDGVLAFGEALREVYLRKGWADRVFTWHEAADTALFRPLPARTKRTSLIWIGNWGDGERAAEVNEFVIAPVAKLHLPTRIHGVRFPQDVCRQLATHNIHYAGWLPNHHAPAAFARAHMTVHVPRRQYVEALPGIPTIRVFEALASGIPLICASWHDEEQLFPADAYLSVRNGEEMTDAMSAVAKDEELRAALINAGLFAIRERHSCAHRVGELLDIVASLQRPSASGLPYAAQATERVA